MIASIFDRREFPTLEQHHYLNQASLGLIGRPAVEAMHGFIDDAVVCSSRGGRIAGIVGVELGRIEFRG